MVDKVASTVRGVENEIDVYYKSNMLLSSSFTEAIWYLLAFYEDSSLFTLFNNPNLSIFNSAAFADNLVYEIKYPINWLKSDCIPGGKIKNIFNKNIYQACKDLSELAYNYTSFVLAFTYASRGLINLILQGDTLYPENFIYQNSRYEAYGRLVGIKDPVRSFIQEDLVKVISRSIKISGSGFTYNFGARLLTQVYNSMSQVFDDIFELPSNWTFKYYTLDEFRRMEKYLMALAQTHFIARYIAAKNGVKNYGYSNNLIIKSKASLIWDFCKHSQVTTKVANHFVDDITYGNRGIKNPDPALQPLIMANEYEYIIMPSLILMNSLERNLVVLFNRIPEEREWYSQLVQNKEDVMRKKIENAIKLPLTRFFHGKIDGRSDLPDIDVAIISDLEKIVFITELKWFIEPSEPREIIEKTEEIIKGINQAELIRRFHENEPSLIQKILNVDETYTIYVVVLSANFIGYDNCQHEHIPVVNVDHFIRKINAAKSFVTLLHWLKFREYLPIQGKHYDYVDVFSQIGKWKLKWYGIKPLITYEFI